MATTMYFEETIKDAGGKGTDVSLEIGKSSYLNGESLIYLNIDGNTLILNEKTGREFVDAVNSLGSYLHY